MILTNLVVFASPPPHPPPQLTFPPSYPSYIYPRTDVWSIYFYYMCILTHLQPPPFYMCIPQVYTHRHMYKTGSTKQAPPRPAPSTAPPPSICPPLWKPVVLRKSVDLPNPPTNITPQSTTWKSG